MRHFCAVLGLLSVLNSNASEGPYLDVFDEFITGWVDYDDGYYAAALRSFARAYALDPEFRPATEAMAASLGHMGMSEVGESILRDRFVSKGREYTYRPAVAFWGVFQSSEIERVSTAGLEETVVRALRSLVDLPVVLTSPSTASWAGRKNAIPCAYNLLIFLFQEPDNEYAIARIHVIRNYSVTSGKELDLALSTQFAHQTLEINLDPKGIAQLSKNQNFHEGLRELFDSHVEIQEPAYRIDAETVAAFDARPTGEPWMHLSKASVSTEFALASYPDIKNYHRPNRDNVAGLAAVNAGMPEWLAHQLDLDHPTRPWLLAEAHYANDNSFRWKPQKARGIREELIRDYPEHPATIAILFAREIWGLNHLNYEEKIPLILPHLEKLKGLPIEIFDDPSDFESLQRFDKTLRACMGQQLSESFVPLIMSKVSQKLSQEGVFSLSFSGGTPKMMKGAVHRIDDHRQFAEGALIHKMATIQDADVLLATYKEHVHGEDAIAAYLKRIRNGVLYQIKVSGNKEAYREACEWWIQIGVEMIETDVSWREIGQVLPSHYLPYAVNYNQTMLSAMNLRLGQRGLFSGDDDSPLALNCAYTWKISFMDLSSQSQEAVIQYYSERAEQDIGSHFEFLRWLNWSHAQGRLHTETLYAQEWYINQIDTETRPRNKGYFTFKYAQMLIAAGEPQIASDMITNVLPLMKATKSTSDRDQKTFYCLRATRAQALANAGQWSKAYDEIHQILQEVDGKLIRYFDYTTYGNRNNILGNGSLASGLLKLKSEIEQRP